MQLGKFSMLEMAKPSGHTALKNISIKKVLFCNFQFRENGLLGRSGPSATQSADVASGSGLEPATSRPQSTADRAAKVRTFRRSLATKSAQPSMVNGHRGLRGRRAVQTVSSSDAGNATTPLRRMEDATASAKISTARTALEALANVRHVDNFANVFLKTNGPFQASFSQYSSFEYSLWLGFEPCTTGVESDRSTNCATTTSQLCKSDQLIKNSWDQCFQMYWLFFNFWQFTTKEIRPIAYKIRF